MVTNLLICVISDLQKEKRKMKIRMKYIKLIPSAILLCLMLFVFHPLFGQEIKATATLDSSLIKIGQQVKLKLKISYKSDKGKQTQVLFPEIADTLRKEVDVVGLSKTDTLVPDKNNPNQFIQSKTIYITSFDSGYWAIPPFKFIVNGDTNGVFTEPLLLQVKGMQVDTTLAIKDIKPPFGENYSFMDWLKDNMWVVYGTLIVIVLILLIIYFVRKYANKKTHIVEVTKPKIPAHIIAFEKLDKLKEAKLWQEGKLKPYYSTLTDILREYIENRFRIQALEQTTDEILYSFRHVSIDEESKSKLKQVLVLADLVKFAKEQPLPSENEMSITIGYDFINGTKKEEVEKIDNKEEQPK